MIFKIDFPVATFKDDSIDGYVSECSVLDVCSQGCNEQDARENIREAITLFLSSSLKAGTLNKVLREIDFTRLTIES